MKKFSIVQLFSVVDGRLSTKMDDVYEILNFVLDEKLATHELPAAMDFIESLTPKPDWYVAVLDAIKEAKSSVGDDFNKLIEALSLKNEYVEIGELPIENLIEFRRHAVENNPLRQRGEGNK